MAPHHQLSRQVQTDYGWWSGLSIHEVGVGHNRNFTVRTGGLSFHLRVYRPLALAEAIECELEVLTALRAAGAPVAAPIPRADDRFFGVIDLEGESRHYAVFEFAEGEPPREWSAQLAEAFGAAVGEVHLRSDTLPIDGRRAELDVARLIGGPVDVLMAGPADSQSRDILFETRDDLAASLLELRAGQSSWGFIHADLHAMNMHVTDHGTLMLFDFDSSAVGPRAHDLALCWMTVPLDRWHSFLNGYQSCRSVATAELAPIKALAKARMISDCSASARDGLGPSGYWSYARLKQICSRIEERPDPLR